MIFLPLVFRVSPGIKMEAVEALTQTVPEDVTRSTEESRDSHLPDTTEYCGSTCTQLYVYSLLTSFTCSKTASARRRVLSLACSGPRRGTGREGVQALPQFTCLFMKTNELRK